MEDKRLVDESEYAVLSPVERHAKLVELYKLLPRLSPDAEWNAALDEEIEVLKPHNEALKNGSESNEEFFDLVLNYSRKNQINLDELEKKGDLERERRASSGDKKLLLGKVSGLLEFSPTTHEFKEVIIEFFGHSYDMGTDYVNESDDLSHAILVEKSESGGFFNQENASDIEMFVYKKEKSGLEIWNSWNVVLDLYKEHSIIQDELYRMMYTEGYEERVKFLEKWEQTIKERYYIDPQV